MFNVRQTQSIDFGNLTGLIGTWKGANGVNLIAVPDQKGAFSLLVRPYTETLTVNAVSATTPNRGLNSIANIPTLQYSTIINDAEDGDLMHVENGFWELVNKQDNNGYDIFRLASIPHGDSMLALGTSSVAAGQPTIDTSLSSIPTGTFPIAIGYTTGYGAPITMPNGSLFVPSAPNEYLAHFLSKLNIKSTTMLPVSTQNNGGISNIPSLNVNTITPQVDATFWIMTVDNGYGNTVQMLAYSQRILIEFPVKNNEGALFPIVWPHINVNVLTLQP